jgi:hemerythrin-like metal-binding protein
MTRKTRLKWTNSSAVFVAELDDDHHEILAALAALQEAIVRSPSGEGWNEPAQQLLNCVSDHLAREERLMKAARYPTIEWHTLQHNHARKCLTSFRSAILRRDEEAATSFVTDLASWLHDHMRLADMMMAAFLRNQYRIGKITFQTRKSTGCEESGQIGGHTCLTRNEKS